MYRSLQKQSLKHFFPEFLHLVLITKYISKCYRSTYYTVVFCVHSQGNRFALEKHVDDNTKQHLMLMCSVVTKQQHQIASLKSALSRLSLNYTGNRTTAATQQLLQYQRSIHNGLIGQISVLVSK